jgi:hypothetical protein
VAVVLAGCGGGDSEPATDTARQLPDLSIPTTRTSPPVTETTPSTTPTTVDPGTETLPMEGPTTTSTTPETPDDTPTTDTPPPEGSPAQRFEQYCNENPGACG